MHGAIAEAGIQPIGFTLSVELSVFCSHLRISLVIVVDSPLDSRLRGNDGGLDGPCDKPMEWDPFSAGMTGIGRTA